MNQNRVTKPGLKQGLVVMFWGPKIASEVITQHQIPNLFPGGACPQTPLASAWTLTLSLVPIRPTNAMPSPLRSDYSSYTPDNTHTKIGTPRHMKAHNAAWTEVSSWTQWPTYVTIHIMVICTSLCLHVIPSSPFFLASDPCTISADTLKYHKWSNSTWVVGGSSTHEYIYVVFDS